MILQISSSVSISPPAALGVRKNAKTQKTITNKKNKAKKLKTYTLQNLTSISEEISKFI